MKTKTLSVLLAIAILLGAISASAEELKGDFNGDAVVNINDALEVYKYLVGFDSIISGGVTADDALDVLRYLAQLEMGTPSVFEPKAVIDEEASEIRYETTAEFTDLSFSLILAITGVEITSGPFADISSSADSFVAGAYNADSGDFVMGVAVKGTVPAGTVFYTQKFTGDVDSLFIARWVTPPVDTTATTVTTTPPTTTTTPPTTTTTPLTTTTTPPTTTTTVTTTTTTTPPTTTTVTTTTTTVTQRVGDINDDGDVTITDALEILKYLAGLTSLVNEADNPEGYNAALITTASREAKKPSIHDALEILKYLAGLPTLVPEKP